MEMFMKVLSESRTTLEAIANLGEAYYEFFKKHRNYYRMLHFFENPQFHKQVSEEMLQFCAGHNQKVWLIVIDAIKRGIDEGVIQRDIDPKEAAVILWASSNGLMRQMDREDNYWRDVMGVDLEAALRRARAMLLGNDDNRKCPEKVTRHWLHNQCASDFPNYCRVQGSKDTIFFSARSSSS